MDPSILNTIRTRPRFVYESHLSKERFLDLLKDYFRKKNKTIGGFVTNDISLFRIRETKDSIWSPCLQLMIEEDPYDKVTYVRGLFGPRPSIWTMFSFFYFGSMVLGLLAFCFYFASLSFSPMPYLLYVGLFFSGLILALFFTSKLGQASTRNQMRLLKTFILMVLKEEYKQKEIN